jgi:hypothetical protein
MAKAKETTEINFIPFQEVGKRVLRCLLPPCDPVTFHISVDGLLVD